MPGGNRTGPNGEGSGTGRGLGYCSGSDTPGYTKGAGMGAGNGFGARSTQRFGSGSRVGRGFGCGRGRGSRFAGSFGTGTVWYNPPDEVGFLENRLNSLKQEITSITKRLKELRPQQPSTNE